jgi:class 3 adenylate cyclase
MRAELPASGGSEVKTIGDAVMLAIPDPAEAILLGLRITHELMRGHGAPAVRGGLPHGPAVEREGDYFGAAVNLAARVSGEASGDEVLLTGQTAALAPELEGVRYEPRGRRELRSVREPVEAEAVGFLVRDVVAEHRLGLLEVGDRPVSDVPMTPGPSRRRGSRARR